MQGIPQFICIFPATMRTLSGPILRITLLLAAILIAQKQTQQVFAGAAIADDGFEAKFIPDKREVYMGTKVETELELTNIDTSHQNYRFELRSEYSNLASVQYAIEPDQVNPQTNSWRGNFTIDVVFMGQTKIFVELVDTLTNATQRSAQHLELIIMRKQRIIDHVFVGSVALLVSLLYINFGAALDVSTLRGLVRRPVGPSIGFITQFLFMPLISYVLGLIIFPTSVEMQLGLFFTGVSPSGGASNIWAVILGGNLNLSVLMTSISNIAAFGMMPLWIFTLGQVIFDRGEMHVPYKNIATIAVSLIVPLAIGLAIQRWLPRVARVLVRLLKPISTILILFIIVFAIVTNLYIFKLFSWQIVVAGLGLPWLGYSFGFLFAKVLRQNSVDALTIAIETGIQNTGISIFLLRFSLPQPQADLTTVIPVSVAIMTPFPLLGLYIYNRCTGRAVKEGYTETTEEHSVNS